MSQEHSHEPTSHETSHPDSNLETPREDLDGVPPDHLGGRASLGQRRMLGLQQTIGNRAVLRSVIQRAPAHNPPAPAAHPAVPAPTATPPAPTAPVPATAPPVAGEAEHRYTINFRPPSGQPISVQNITAEEAQRLIVHIAAVIDNFIAAGREGHTYLIHVQSDAWFTSTVTDLIGGHVIPPLSIWESPAASMDHARGYMSHGNVRDALQAMYQATRMANNASSRLAQYREDTAQGVAQVQVYLEYTEAAGAVAATVVTGGLAEGVLATAAVAATTAGVYAAAQNAAGQASEIGTGLRQNFDVMDMLRRGAREAIVGFVAAITGGALKAGFGRLISGFMENPNVLLFVSNALGENGPLLAEFIAANLSRLSTEFISFIGSTALTTAVTNVVTRMLGNAQDLTALRRVEEQGFLRQVWHALVQGGITALLIAFLQRTMPTRSPRPAPQTQTPELPPGGPRVMLEPPRSSAPGGGSNQEPIDPLAATQPALAAPVDPLGATQANPQAPVDPLAATQPDTSAPVDPLAVTQPASRAPGGAQSGGVSPVARAVQASPMSVLSYEQAQGALSYFRMGGQGSSHGGVGITPDWEIYVANYQIVAGHGAVPPPHGYVGPDGYINLYLPRRGNLLGPNEAPPPLPLSLGGTPASAGAASTSTAASASSSSQPVGAQGSSAVNETPFGGVNPASGNTLSGTGQAGEPTGTRQVNEGEPAGQQNPSAISGQTMTGLGNRPFTPLTRQQAEAIHEYIGQWRALQLSMERRDDVQNPSSMNRGQEVDETSQFHEQLQNRVNELERQIGSPDLILRARTHNGHSNLYQRASYQANFQQFTGSTQPAPEGGFITDDGYVVTLSSPGE